MTKIDRLIQLQEQISQLAAEEKALNFELCKALQRHRPQGHNIIINRLDITGGDVRAERVQVGYGGSIWVEPYRWSQREVRELIDAPMPLTSGLAPALCGDTKDGGA